MAKNAKISNAVIKRLPRYRRYLHELDKKGVDKISSAELFAKNEITMVNIWATWCGPCVGELGELQELHTRMQEKECGIVGLLDDDKLEEARRLVQQGGIALDDQRVDAIDARVSAEALKKGVKIKKGKKVFHRALLG